MDIRIGTIIHTDDDGSFIVSEIGSGGVWAYNPLTGGRRYFEWAELRSIRQ